MHVKRVDCFCACFAEPLLQGQQKLDPAEAYHMISPVSIEHSSLCDVQPILIAKKEVIIAWTQDDMEDITAW